MKKLVLIVVGTRPEAIKLIPVYLALKNSDFYPLLVTTDQHKKLLEQTLSLFGVEPDFSLNIMKENQSLDYLTSAIIQKTHALFSQLRPTLVVVQGDTATAFGSALSAYYLQIPVAHIEAGLRTGNIFSPFPEEINRRFITQISMLHFAPTPLATQYLLHEGARENRVFCVGNTVVDALALIQSRIRSGIIKPDVTIERLIENNKSQHKRLVLLTCHRRESFNGGLSRILSAIKKAADRFHDLFFIFPVHPNPHVQKAVSQADIAQHRRITCISAVSYENLIYMLNESELVITDSGGIQEEAISLGKNVLIMRDHTERMEALWEGLGMLVGSNEEKILDAISRWHNTKNKPKSRHVYGDGRASERIVSQLKKTTFLPHIKQIVPMTKGAIGA